MSDKVFDTIILIYAISEGDARALIAERLLTSGGILSVQVLNEFAAVAKKKLKMSWREIAEALRIANIPILKDRSLEVNRKKRSRRPYQTETCLYWLGSVRRVSSMRSWMPSIGPFGNDEDSLHYRDA
jgi:predicted nucleic acid-binding protein